MSREPLFRQTQVRAVVLTMLAGTPACIYAGDAVPSVHVSADAVTYASYYVSPLGSDSNDGLSAGHPFATIAHARDVVRTIPRRQMKGNIVVNLMDGTYLQTKTLAFQSQDSGFGGNDVIYQAYNFGTAQQANPVISGGVSISGWTLHDSAKNIWQADVGTSLQTRQVYVNGERAQRASGAAPSTLTKKSDGTGHSDSAATMASWGNPGDIELVFQGTASGADAWTESRCDVATISGTSITLRQPCWGTVLAINSGVSLPSSIENAYELLDQPGEWYLDHAKGVLYYSPRPGEDMSVSTVVASTLETLLSGTGTLDAPIEMMQFRGLTFAHATWLRPSTNDGFAEFQANFTGVNPGIKTPANVTFHGAQSIRFERDTFTHLGGAALAFEYGSHKNTVVGCVFTDISGSGVQIGDVNDFHAGDSREINSGNQVLDSYIHAIGAEFHGAVGIWEGYTQGSLLAHNQIDDVPYSGISTGWGWGEAPTSPNINRNNQIKNNLVFNHMRVLADGGGIYSLGQQGTTLSDGLLIDSNVVHGQRHDYHAVYNDGGSDYVTTQNNVLYDSPDDWGGCKTGHEYGNFLFQNNYWENPQTGFGCGAPINVTIQSNTQIDGAVGCSAVSACQKIVDNAGIELAYRDILGDADVAVRQPVYTSSDFSSDYEGAKANDDNIGTGWSPAADDGNPWLEVDLGKPVTLSRIELVTRQDLDQPETRQNFTVWASNNADMSLGYDVLGSYGTPPLPLQGTWTLDVMSKAAYRYLAVVKTKSEYFFVAELRAFAH